MKYLILLLLVCLVGCSNSNVAESKLEINYSEIEKIYQRGFCECNYNKLQEDIVFKKSIIQEWEGHIKRNQEFLESIKNEGKEYPYSLGYDMLRRDTERALRNCQDKLDESNKELQEFEEEARKCVAQK